MSEARERDVPAEDAPFAVARVLERGAWRGPSAYGRLPMVRFMLDLGTLEAWPSDRLPNFTDRLLGVLPSLQEHGCSYRKTGGFVRRLREGTWFGHVSEHVALELQSLAGQQTFKGKTRSVRGKPGVYNVMYGYREEAVGFMAGRLALQLLEILLPSEFQGIEGLDRLYADPREPALTEPFEIEAALEALKRLARRSGFGPSTRSLVQEAERRGIPVMRLDDQSFVQLGWGRRQERLRASMTGRTSHIAVENAGHKHVTRALLLDAGLPAPRGEVVRTAEEAAKAARTLKFPVVTKPLDGNHGRGVSVGLDTAEAVQRGFELAQRHSPRVIVEEMLQGHDHRVLVVGGEVVAVAERIPAHVIGDGSSTIAELVAITNRDVRRGEGHETVMTRIRIDDHVRDVLARSGMTPESTPALGVSVQLRDTANLSTGGTAVDRTDEIHPENAMIARRAANTIGLDVAGIDFLVPDIRKSVRETGHGGIVEVNAAPGFRMHLHPSEGRPRNVARPVLDMLYPRGSQSRIPIIAITGTNGKSTTCRMVGRIFRATGATVGMTSTSGIYLNEERIAALDASGPKSARLVLREQTVDVAVLETARGGILREGLGFDRCDAGAVLNVDADHLGVKGMDTVEDLAWVKAVVVESVARDGVSVLNADDRLTVGMNRRSGGRTAWFSLCGGDGQMPDFVRRHVALGGMAVVREPGAFGGEIVIWDHGDRLPLMSAGEIPATLRGAAEFNVANALAAVALAYGQGIAPPMIRMALASFASTFEQVPGRLNVFDGHAFRVILDYAHNPAGLLALGKVIASMRPQYRRVIAVVSTPGDRRDEDIREVGRIAAEIFDELVFREAPDGRGRPEGDILRLLTEGAVAGGAGRQRIHPRVHEREAVDTALRGASPGDLVVLLPTEVEETWREVIEFDGRHVNLDDGKSRQVTE